MGRVFLISFLLGVLQASAAESPYAVSKIPAHLLINAHAVIRLDETRFEVNSLKETTLWHHYVVTVLEPAGASHAVLQEYYDPFREINSIEGILYDANGKQIKKIKKKDTDDLNGTDADTWIGDVRRRYYNFYHKTYPYTVEYTVEITNKESFFFPRWIPVGYDHVSLEQSSLRVITPASYQFRYKTYNTGEPVKSTEKNNNISSWQISNIAALNDEAYTPLLHEIVPAVLLGPSEFQIEGYKGSMNNWADFGKFITTLRKDRDILPAATKQTVQQLAATGTTKEKIIRLYEFMQQHTRYVSIQLGIGGWQPLDANFVATKGYGDCKALTNYMYSLLKEAGIKSYYTLVRAGRGTGYIAGDFPAQQFNHVILCVPDDRDTVWLECTSQTLPAGYLSAFTAARPVLLITENGGELINTPAYTGKDNIQIRNVKSVLRPGGDISLNVKSSYRALQQDELQNMLTRLSKDKVKEYLHEQLDFATYDVDQFDYHLTKSALPIVNESLAITVKNYASLTGKRLFVVPNLMTRSYRHPILDNDRKFPVELNFGFIDIDTVSIQLPPGYKVETMPGPLKLSTQFGTYSNSIEVRGDVLYYTRTVEQFTGRFPSSEYNNLVRYYQSIFKADREKVVLIKE